MRLKLKRLLVPFSESKDTNFLAEVWIVSELTGKAIGEIEVQLPFIPEASKEQSLNQFEAMALAEARKHVGNG